MAAAAEPEIEFNAEGWPLSPAGYESLAAPAGSGRGLSAADEIGAGAFARVCSAVCTKKLDEYGRKVPVAIKILSLESISTSLEEIQAEVKAMKASKHENVLDL